MSENLKPIVQMTFIDADGKETIKSVEFKRTRKLLLNYNSLVKEIRQDDDAVHTCERVLQSINLIQDEITALDERVVAARNEYYDDPTSEVKEAKYNKLIALYKEKEKVLLSSSTEREYVDKMQKQLIDIYEKCLIYSLVEQGYCLSVADAEKVFASFVEETGVQSAAEWVMAIGQYLFAREDDDNSFLSQMRAKQMKQAEARKQIGKKK